MERSETQVHTLAAGRFRRKDNVSFLPPDWSSRARIYQLSDSISGLRAIGTQVPFFPRVVHPSQCSQDPL